MVKIKETHAEDLRILTVSATTGPEAVAAWHTLKMLEAQVAVGRALEAAALTSGQEGAQ